MTTLLMQISHNKCLWNVKRFSLAVDLKRDIIFSSSSSSSTANLWVVQVTKTQLKTFFFIDSTGHKLLVISTNSELWSNVNNFYYCLNDIYERHFGGRIFIGFGFVFFFMHHLSISSVAFLLLLTGFLLLAREYFMKYHGSRWWRRTRKRRTLKHSIPEFERKSWHAKTKGILVIFSFSYSYLPIWHTRTCFLPSSIELI